MRTIWTLAVVGLLGLGCGGNDGKADLKSSKGEATGGQDTGAPRGKSQTPVGGSATGRNVDPAMKGYEYPGSKFEDMVSIANTVSAIYKSGDDFEKVVAFYRQKFPDAPPRGPGTNAYFLRKFPDGNSLTVTLTGSNDVTQIILKLSKRM